MKDLLIVNTRIDRRALLRGVAAVAAVSSVPWRQSFALDALSSGGHPVALSEAALADLQKSIQGQVILPSSAQYDSARRVWNPRIDGRPALIAMCSSVADVQATVQFARSHDLLTAVRCGGHSYAGFSMPNGGLVIDLSSINGVEVDPTKQRAWVDGGARLGNLDRATAPHGLATTAGVVSHTGVGGLATVCGQGRLARKHGYTIDNIRALELVTAEGRLVRANSTENPDLFWAVRGGSGNFGIVTKFEFELYELDPSVTSFSYVYGLDQAKAMMDLYFELSEHVPNEMSLSAGLNTSDKGETTASISGTYLGTPEAAEKLLAPLAPLGTPARKRLDAIDYVKLQSIADGTSLFSPRAVYYRSGYFNHVDSRLTTVFVDYVTKSARPGTSIRFSQQGGVAGKVPTHATAFADRDALHQCAVDVEWTGPNDEAQQRKYADDSWAVLAPMSDGSFYLNFATDLSDAEVRRTFRGNYPRLVDVKTKYDPKNFFHLNPNIKPRSA